jgi:hypothetical protein
MELARALDLLPVESKAPRERFLEALELYDQGVALERLVLKRRFPDLSPELIEEKLQRWLLREDEH